MGAVYTVSMADTTIVANATLVIIHADSTAASRGSLLEILRAGVSQNGTATSQQLGIILGYKATAYPTVTSVTPTPHVAGGVASAIVGATTGAEATCGVDASAEGAGAVTNVFQDGFNNLNGWLWVPTPEERLILLPDQAIIVKMVGTPTTLTNWNAYITFREIN